MIPPAPPAPESGRGQAAALKGFGQLGWWEYDLRTGEVRWDDRARKIFGIPGTGPLTLEDATSVIHPDDRELANAVVAKALQPDSAGDYTVRKRIIRDDGIRWVQAIGHVEWADERPREPVRLVGIVEDITDRSAPGGWFASAISGSEVILSHFDRDLRYTWIFNPDRHFDPDAVIGRRDDELAPAEWVAELMAVKQEIVERGEEINRVIEVTVDGDPRHYSLHATPLRGADGSIIGGATVSADVTAQVRAETVARQANEDKSRFMSTVSHEMKTPLAGILGFADLLEEGIPDPIPESALEHVRRIKVTVEQMRGLIEELLTYSRLQAGHEQLSLEPEVPAELAARALTVAEGLARRQGLDLEREIPADLPVLTTDGQKLVRILTNLLGNAFNYTETGTVRLAVEAQGGMCFFHVTDTGIGIEPEQLDTIFEPFGRTHRGAVAAPGGTGLGLPIALQTARLLGGDLEVESQPGRGSRFTLRVPVRGPEG